jgi:hypothetical protein
MSVIDKARGDKRVQDILCEVSSRVKLRYQKSKSEEWSSNLENGKAIIGYNRCQSPSAALAHELLHIDAQLRGYRRMRICFSSIDQTGSFKNLMNCLDNVLQHRKFYPKFLSMGFRPDQFYCDSDQNIEGYLTQAAQRSYQKLIDLMPDFLAVIAPGGSLSENSQQRLRGMLLAVENGKFSQQLQGIEDLFREWAACDTYDAVETVKKIMLTIQPTDNFTWIGFDANDRRPASGFFVDAEFFFAERES